jgi:Pyridoxal-phosphate dependent enzyme
VINEPSGTPLASELRAMGPPSVSRALRCFKRDGIRTRGRGDHSRLPGCRLDRSWQWQRRTQSGLLAGLLALGHSARVIGVDVDAQASRVTKDVQGIGREAAAMLGVEERWIDSRVEVAADWSGPAYGEADASTEEAIRLAARLEGLPLDPVYSGKGMAGAFSRVRKPSI